MAWLVDANVLLVAVQVLEYLHHDAVPFVVLPGVTCSLLCRAVPCHALLCRALLCFQAV